jgi:hypothetical protein
MASRHELKCPGCQKHFGNVLIIHSDRLITDQERDSCWCSPCAEREAKEHPVQADDQKTGDRKRKQAILIALELEEKKITVETAFRRMAELFGR